MCLCVCVCVKTGIHFYNSRSITTGVCDQPECVCVYVSAVLTHLFDRLYTYYLC